MCFHMFSDFGRSFGPRSSLTIPAIPKNLVDFEQALDTAAGCLGLHLRFHFGLHLGLSLGRRLVVGQKPSLHRPKGSRGTSSLSNQEHRLHKLHKLHNKSLDLFFFFASFFFCSSSLAFKSSCHSSRQSQKQLSFPKRLRALYPSDNRFLSLKRLLWTCFST